MVRYFLAHGADPDEHSLIAAVDKSLELMQLLLQARLSRYGRHSRGFGSRAMQHAIASLNPVMVEVLLSSGVDPTTIIGSRDHEMKWLKIASLTGYTESGFGTVIRLDRSRDRWMIQILLRGSADPNKMIDEGSKGTILLAAIEQKSMRLVETLVAAGANVNPRPVGKISRTPLQLAVEQGNIDIIVALMEQGADVNASPCDRYGATALQLEAIKGYLGIASMLVEKGADINASPAKVEGRTALEGASEHARIDVLQFLLSAGAQVTGPGNEQYERARRFAAKNGHIAARRLLENYHAERLSDNIPWDLVAVDVGNIEDLEFEHLTGMGEDMVNPMPVYA